MNPFGHQHRYEAVAVDHKDSPGTLWSQTVKATLVLFRCGCGDVYSKTLAGSWTLSQVRGERNLTDRERVETDLAVEAARA